MLNHHMWLAAIILDSADTEHLHHCRKFYCAMFQEIRKTLISRRVLHSSVPSYLCGVHLLPHPPIRSPVLCAKPHVLTGYCVSPFVTAFVSFPFAEKALSTLHTTPSLGSCLPRKPCSPFQAQCKSSFFRAVLHDAPRKTRSVPFLWSDHRCANYKCTPEHLRACACSFFLLVSAT